MDKFKGVDHLIDDIKMTPQYRGAARTGQWGGLSKRSGFRAPALVSLHMSSMLSAMLCAVLHMQNNRFPQANTDRRALTLLFP
jgi:hypothetical protein